MRHRFRHTVPVRQAHAQPLRMTDPRALHRPQADGLDGSAQLALNS